MNKFILSFFFMFISSMSYASFPVVSDNIVIEEGANFVNTTNVDGISVNYNGVELPNPVPQAIIDHKTGDISQWYAFPIGGLCERYKLIGVHNEHYIDLTSQVNQEQCDA